MMGLLNWIASLIGWMVFILWLLGAIGLGDFTLRFGPPVPKDRPVVCRCSSMGCPEQCDEGSGCRWKARLERLAGNGKSSA